MKFTLATLSLCAASVLSLDMSAPAVTEEMVHAINKKQSSWKAHVSPRFVNATLGDVAMLLGAVQSTDPGFEPLPEATHYKGLHASALPTSYDATTAIPQCSSLIGHVRDQSSCGSCWAFASTEAFNDRRCIAYNDQTFYSAEDTLACCSGLKCGLSNGCNGGQPTSAWKWFTSAGVTTGGGFETMNTGQTCNPYPFEACAHHVESSVYPACPSDEYSTPKCSASCLDTKYTKKYADDKVLAKSAYSISGVTKMMEELVTYGPITACLTVYEDFTSYQSGVYVHTSGSALGGHAIEIVGYGHDEASGLDYWKVKNSWNDSWGNGGYFWIKKGTNECGIEGTVSAGLV